MLKKIKTVKRIYDSGLMGIVRVDSDERASEIANACLSGGIDVLEISYTNNSAGTTIQYLKEMFGGKLLVGAGTVLDSETARHAILHGADFVIAPTLSKEVAILCNRYQVPYAPGCTSYSEAIQGLEYGASFIKAFPISNFYGPKLGAVFTTPVPEMPILVSGGASFENLGEWLDAGVAAVGFGSLLTKGTVEEIQNNALKLRSIFKSHRW